MPPSGPGNLTIVNALVFDGVSADLTEGSVRIADGVIIETGDVRSPGGEVIDAAGRTLIPGLIDAHFHAYAAHIDQLSIEAGSLSYLALAAARRLGAALSRGFTTVRDVAGGDAGLARAIAEELIQSPRYLFTGPALSQTGGHGDPRPVGLDLHLCGGSHMCEVVDGADALRTAVRERLRQGAHAIKIMTSGGVISPADPIGVPQYSAGEVRAVTEEATRRGSYVVAHAYSPEAIVHSVRNGVRSIEHGNLLDGQSAREIADGGAFLVPTLAAYDAMERRGAGLGLTPVSQAKNREVLDAGRRAVQIAREAGVRIGFGTDLMGPLEDEQLLGLRLQAEVDGTLAVLRSATSVNADLLGRGDLGRIAIGAAGDMVILDGNPLERPAVLWAASSRRTVIKAGIRLRDPCIGRTVGPY